MGIHQAILTKLTPHKANKTVKWVSARNTKLQCVSNGVTVRLSWINPSISYKIKCYKSVISKVPKMMYGDNPLIPALTSVVPPLCNDLYKCIAFSSSVVMAQIDVYLRPIWFVGWSRILFHLILCIKREIEEETRRDWGERGGRIFFISYQLLQSIIY